MFKILYQNKILFDDKLYLIYIFFKFWFRIYKRRYYFYTWFSLKQVLIPPKSRNKGKALQQKPKSLKPPNPLKLLSSAISYAKPIKSWNDMVTEKEEELNHSSQVQTWVDSFSNSPKLLLALQTISQKSIREGKSSQPIS